MVVFQQPNLLSLSGAFICLALFHLLYVWRFDKETFWQVNRVYLLLAPIVAWMIPHVRVVLTPEVVNTTAIDPNVLLLLQQWRGNIGEVAPSAVPQIGEILLGIYLTGVVWSLLRLGIQSYRILRIAKQGTRREYGDWTFVVHENLQGPASFFHFVFSSTAQPLPEMILQHELVHVRQRHTLDVLLMECWVALHWYNPLIYRMRDRLRVTHEFIADAAVVEQQTQGAFAYASLLISQPLNQSVMPFNTFAAQINSRLRMLARRPSASWRVLTHAITLPVGLALLLFFSVQLVEATPIAKVVETVKQLEAAPILPPTELPTIQTELPVYGATHLLQPDTVPVKSEQKVIIVQGYKADSVQMRVEIRKDNASSSGADKALIVIDGVIQEASSEEVLGSMNPGDIKSINILKGESATKAYGEKGKEGVIEIITKKNTSAASPANTEGTENIEVTVDIKTIEGKPLKPSRKKSNTVRITSNGELIGEVKQASGFDESASMGGKLIIEEIREVRVETGGKETSTDVRTITLDFSDRKRAEEALKSLKKNRR